MAGDRADVLILAPKQTIVEGLAKAFTLHKLWEATDREAFLDSIAPRVRGIATVGGHAPVGPDLMSRLPNLEIVSSFGVGYDHVDAKWAGEQGIVVTNTPDVLTEEVADTALGLLLCTVREFPQAERYVRAGKWTKAYYPLTKASLRDRTVGIVGLGRIGKAIAKRAEAFDMSIAYTARTARPDAGYRYLPSAAALAAEVDFLVVITPGGAGTRKLIDASVLEALGPRGYLVNVARGSVVDETALVQALQNGTIAGAGLDVFEQEPNVPAALCALDNVVLTPHIGSATQETRQAMSDLAFGNLEAHFAGRPLLTPVPR
jgi:lactate dehydrogenase-like 2-hydroxyacid dehydrogenase